MVIKMGKLHSGIFCPITKEKCRMDCAALKNAEYCKLIDGQETQIHYLIEVIAELKNTIVEVSR